jgi:hypothetical protein
MRGVDALWNEFEKGMQEDSEHTKSDSISEKSTGTTVSIPGTPYCKGKRMFALKSHY